MISTNLCLNQIHKFYRLIFNVAIEYTINRSLNFLIENFLIFNF